MRKCLLLPAVVAGMLATSAVIVAQNTDPMVGTWKQNMEKSESSTVQGRTFKVEAIENGLKTTDDHVDAQGKSVHTETILKFDGKDYPVPNAQQPNTTTAARRIDAYSYETVEKIDGKVTLTNRVVVSRDGKTRTSVATGRENVVRVYDRQ